MEPPQFYITVSEGVYSSWRAIGVLENLHTDGDITQFLVTLYSSQKQKTGEETSLRCVHCHCPLTLYCGACQCPSHLALPSLPPPPSLPSEALAPVSVTSDTDGTPVLKLEKLVTDVSGVKEEEESDGTLLDEEEFVDSSFDFDSAHLQPTFSASCTESRTAEPDVGLCFTSSLDERRKSQRLARQSVSRVEPRKKRTATNVQSEKAAKKKYSDRNQNAANRSGKDTDVKGKKKLKEGFHMKTEQIWKESTEKTSDNNVEIEAQSSCGNVAAVDKQKQGHRKRKPCASQDLEVGFILSEEERSLAQVHVYDDSFYENHKIEDEPPKRPGRPKKKCPSSLTPMKTDLATQERRKRKLRHRDPSVAAHSDGSLPDEETQTFPQHTFNEDVSPPKKDRTEDNQSHETDRQPLRILVSAQKILPLWTTTGNYAHNFYSYFECFHCKKAFVHKRAFNSHVQTHIEPKVYTCTLCGKGFKRSCDRIKHERRHKFECVICGKKYTDNTELQDHLKVHTENNGIMKCLGCEFETLDFHEYQKHKSKCTIVQCEICGVRLKSLYALRFHISAVHENDRPYKCTLCEKSFVLQTNLKSHMKYRHAEGGRAFHCDQCSYRAFDARALDIHQRCVHSDERPFKCTYCPSAFARKFYLVVHLRKHTGEKPHRCSECSQSFAQKPSLTRHRRTHHGLEPAGHKKAAELHT
ncbi:uncharacterized protein LOC143302329 [Babylonia areolata]|uniref:uncharacterized protein LOC143302329 n=1 Tax=Babylonia areolata TaxID=304850 RepID=UPI003FD38EB2